MFRKLAVVWLLLLAVVIMQSSPAFAQGKKNKGPAERTITGVVSDEAGKPVAGAVVQLKNTKTLQIRSFISQDNGQFFFNGLGTDVDYEVTAKAGALTSQKRVLSSFDSREQAVINLTVK